MTNKIYFKISETYQPCPHCGHFITLMKHSKHKRFHFKCFGCSKTWREAI